ncbi:hypothetical protein TCAL_03028 [Tigriopus californicus]|uniref:DNA damage-binding protein 2 n=1 Tax=Tigriopus californicus TaxID=6832 RepID=A0A553NTC0_TIGCA|nr:DNA damage-binding protein 2-like [Tigriopus californicus]TRY68670.1 hypothetical protein TCAL_03028 [Tigriopus californicus]|eukprot:TCALIF_03028-PA protein Name:"Similar to ddb2 DNA damage-binding protein 2 (Xenopus tropicalis)" AED:0.04 eAED:0.04 QI:0/-1/0/1/-1/1/1/0/453
MGPKRKAAQLTRINNNEPIRAKNAAKKAKSKIDEDVENEPLPSGPSSLCSRNRVRPPAHLVGVLQGHGHGLVGHFNLERFSRLPIIEEISHYGVFKSVTPFDTRTTSLAWHPSSPSLCAVGSKWGDIMLWNYQADNFQNLEPGRGPGGSILAMKFDIENDCRLYTCSIDGKMAVQDFVGQKSRVFLSTDDWEHWYTSFDVSFTGGTVITGDNKGFVTLMTKDGEVVWRSRLHPKKVTNLQFSPREPYLLISTSVDNSVKVWDIRNIKDRKSALASLEHDKPVNSAYFNPVNGTRLLTTDQHSQLRVYRSPHWDLERLIPHPHRQFQHLTPIKATWHPLADIVLAGRYPHDQFPGYEAGEQRSVDFIDPDDGKMLFQLTQPGMNNIISLNLFSPSGDAMLSGMSSTVLIWKPKPKFEMDEKLYKETESNIKDLMVEEWPEHRPKRAKNKKKTRT